MPSVAVPPEASVKASLPPSVPPERFRVVAVSASPLLSVRVPALIESAPRLPSVAAGLKVTVPVMLVEPVTL